MSDGTPQSNAQQLQQAQTFTIQTFLASLIASFVVFGVQVGIFLLIKGKLPRIYRPRTYLVPERERIKAPPDGLWRWVLPVFATSNSDFIQKCGLDAYFFLRFLRMLLKIFIPLALIILPVLVPVNAVGGRGLSFVVQPPFDRNLKYWNTTDQTVVGLNQLAWGNVRPDQTGRYWVHLWLAVAVILFCLYTFYDELRGYIRLRQAYLTSPQHRIRASATTVLVSAIPRKWCTIEALDGLYDVFPGGIRNIWLNRNFTELSEKVEERNDLALKLEAAQTALIRKAKKKQMEQLKKDGKKSGKKQTKAELTAENQQRDHAAADLAEGNGADADGGSLKEQKSPIAIPVIGEGIEAAGKIGMKVFGGLRTVGTEVNDQLTTTQGFQMPAEEDREPLARSQNDGVSDGIGPGYHIPGAEASRPPKTRTRPFSQDSNAQPTPALPPESSPRPQTPPPASPPSETANSPSSTYGAQGIDDRINRKSGTGAPGTAEMQRRTKPGPITPVVKPDEKHTLALPSPIPKGHAANGFPGSGGPERSFLAKMKFWAKEEVKEGDREEYPEAFDKDFDSIEDDEPLWKKYLKSEDRETMRVGGPPGLGWLPCVGTKVDTIEYCRKEVARLNVEIEADQQDPEKYPLMNSAFIQFNHQVAAHLACQSVTHHVPGQMNPRVVEISPGDVIWDNLSLQWWERYVRTGIALSAVVGLVLAWTFPVAFTGLLANIKSLSTQYSWLSWLGRIPYELISPIQGILPQVLLAILMALLPIILRFLTKMQGFATGMAVELMVSNYYFFFLFVQVFLVVTIAAGATNVFTVANSLAGNPASIPGTLATTIPRASNYYFSYLLLQALSTSSGQLLQISGLVGWFLLAPLFDSTARAKWKRQITLPDMQWGTFFPVYTNMACIGLIYCVISPLILIFNCITFSLFWFVFRYNTLYITKFEFDTGGLLFPKAINHLFTGVYVMEICLIGLFFLVTGVDSEGKPGNHECIAQGIIMIVVLVCTVLFQLLLQWTFGPLVRYLPITLEDEAVARDDEFARAQGQHFNLVDEERDGDDINDLLEAREERERAEDDAAEAIELHDISERRRSRRRFDPRSLATSAGDALHAMSPVAVTNWADRTRRRPSAWLYTPNTAHQDNRRIDDLVRAHRLRAQAHYADLENGHADSADGKESGEKKRAGTTIGDALFAGISDEIEDLSAEDRDFLVQHAFQHAALRARRPVIWIPRDDLGVSDDEVQRTRRFSKEIWISNEHTGLDSKVRVVYRKSPPDFSEVDLIEL